MISPDQAKQIARIRAGEDVWINFSGHRILVSPNPPEPTEYQLALVPFLTRANLGIVADIEKHGATYYGYRIFNGQPYIENCFRSNNKRFKIIGSILEIHKNLQG